jgi:hypothetical protein
MKPYIARYITHFDLKPDLIGEVVGKGKQHTIYRYGDKHILKIPRRSLYMRTYGALEYEILQRDLGILRTFAGAFVPQTEVLAADDGEDYIVIQEWLRGAQFVNQANFAHVREQFLQIVEANRQIVAQHHLSLDYLGYLGFQRSIFASLLRRKSLALMTNLLVIQTDAGYGLRIVDINLSELRFARKGGITLFHWGMDVFSFRMADWLIADNFGVTVYP